MITKKFSSVENIIRKAKKGKNFQIWCIPHTLKLTNLSSLKVNDIVNIEIDILSKYVKKFYENKKV